MFDFLGFCDIILYMKKEKEHYSRKKGVVPARIETDYKTGLKPVF